MNGGRGPVMAPGVGTIIVRHLTEGTRLPCGHLVAAGRPAFIRLGGGSGPPEWCTEWWHIRPHSLGLNTVHRVASRIYFSHGRNDEPHQEPH